MLCLPNVIESALLWIIYISYFMLRAFYAIFHVQISYKCVKISSVFITYRIIAYNHTKKCKEKFSN